MPMPMEEVHRDGHTVARASLNLDAIGDWRLGVPGPFVEDSSLAGPHFLELGPMEVVRRQLEGPPLSGMRSNSGGVSLLLELLPSSPGGESGLDVLVTHDSIIAAFDGYLLESVPNAATWPSMLDGPIIWRLASGLGIARIGQVQCIDRQLA